MPFRALGLDAKIIRAITEAGYTEPTPIQAAAIPPIIAGNDLIGIAQTGTGKTAAFTLPILTKLAAQPDKRRGTKVLIIAPTRELVVQIQENLHVYAKHLPLTIATVFGGVSERPQIQALRNGADVVIACAGRMLDLMGQRAADFSQLKFLVLDEADRMLDMGFLPDIQRIVQQLPKERQTLMFSATLSKEIEALTHKFQRSPKMIQIGRRANPAETVTQLVYEVPRHLKSSLLLHLLRDPQMGMVLVFSRMKHNADRIAHQLEQKGVRCATLHSNRSQNQRLRALKDFKDGAVRVLVATDIAARGIDVDGISHVVNYDFPVQPEDYVHRIGRTGRAHAVGDAISFVSSEEYGALRHLERFIGRGIVRKKAEGFDYKQAAQVFSLPAEPRDFRQGQNRPQQSGRPQYSRGGGQPRQERSERPSRPGYPQRSHGGHSQQERSGYPQRPQRSEYPNRPYDQGGQSGQEQSGRPQRPPYSDRPQRSRSYGSHGDKPWQERSDRPSRPGYPQHSHGGQPQQERSGYSQRPQRSENPNRPRDFGGQSGPEQSGRPQRPQPSGRPQRSHGYGGHGGQPRQERSGRSPWRR
jgi:ATP-dependent RNA helicase RhlE